MADARDGEVRRSSRGARTRARLLQATREVVAVRGFVAARVEDIVATAGVSHGTFYTYFDNKAAALDALIDAAAAELQAVVDEPWDGPDGASAIGAVIGRFVAAFAEHADVVRAWIEAAAHDPVVADRLQEVRGGYVRRVAEVVAPVLAGSGHDPTLVATALVAMVEGTVTQQRHATEDLPTPQLVRTLSSLWVGGLLGLGEDPTSRG
ncbi:MAG: TetR/AcrR family transcriptional regulator [Nitriliruptoraceae bacterium]